MNNSSLASEFMLRATRTLKEASNAFNEGDLFYTGKRVLETIENLSTVILTIYGIYSVSGNPITQLDYLLETRDLQDNVKMTIRDLQKLYNSLVSINIIDESSLKSPSVLARHNDMKVALDELSKLFERVEGIFDDFHG
ncbi:hypothetical protein CM19_03030 [Candidatus Acidianus copahuensis]|uniref:HEPN domain-containing protein n=1 Tax=Candidatus Acidianus copahuensis TaxID=1160895 RepID=A0A031LUK0_9CREN|nr:hypothetical protein [Candidatus Acidianus copahuensis]EZQ10823.1 hypothetical protein CM19_03030 [Candidatus Acidianus copahuensis]